MFHCYMPVSYLLNFRLVTNQKQVKLSTVYFSRNTVKMTITEIQNQIWYCWTFKSNPIWQTDRQTCFFFYSRKICKTNDKQWVCKWVLFIILMQSRNDPPFNIHLGINQIQIYQQGCQIWLKVVNWYTFESQTSLTFPVEHKYFMINF